MRASKVLKKLLNRKIWMFVLETKVWMTCFLFSQGWCWNKHFLLKLGRIGPWIIKPKFKTYKSLKNHFIGLQFRRKIDVKNLCNYHPPTVSKTVAIVDRWSLFRGNLCYKWPHWDLKLVAVIDRWSLAQVWLFTVKWDRMRVNFNA